MTDELHPVGALRTRMEIRTYPRDDGEFRAAVLATMRRFDRIRDMSAIPGRLERLLAEAFPYARARYQDSLASTNGVPLLYAFRDGALVSMIAAAQDGHESEATTASREAAGAGAAGTATAVR